MVHSRYLQDSPQPNLNGKAPIWLGDAGYRTDETESATSQFDDYNRVEYYKGWLNQVLKCEFST